MNAQNVSQRVLLRAADFVLTTSNVTLIELRKFRKRQGFYSKNSKSVSLLNHFQSDLLKKFKFFFKGSVWRLIGRDCVSVFTVGMRVILHFKKLEFFFRKSPILQ